jgi:hypothetical protein
MLSCSFGMLRWRKEGLVVGVRIRARARACVCRWEERREPICGRWVGSEVHWEVASRSFWEDGERGAEVRREERRKTSSRSSVGRVAGVFVGALDLEVVVGAAEKSRLLSAFRMRWNFAARMQAVLRACSIVSGVRDGEIEGVLLSPHRALFAQGGSWSSHSSSGYCLPE